MKLRIFTRRLVINRLTILTLVVYSGLSCQKNQRADQEANKMRDESSTKAKPVKFIPTFTPLFVFDLSGEQADHLRELIGRLKTKTIGTGVLSYVPGQEYGSFFCEDKEFKWQGRYLYYHDPKTHKWIVLEDERLNQL